VRPGAPVSFPVGWGDLDRIAPRDFTVHTAMGMLGDTDPWAEAMPAPMRLGADLIEEGNAIPIARVQAMHEGKRRARARRSRIVQPFIGTATGTVRARRYESDLRPCQMHGRAVPMGGAPRSME